MPPSSTLGNFGTIIISKLFINPIHIQTIRALCEFVWYDLRNYVRFRYEGFVSSVISGPNETILNPPPRSLPIRGVFLGLYLKVTLVSDYNI